MQCVLQHNGLSAIIDFTGKEVAVCTKKCYNSLALQFAGKGCIVWEKDGKEGPNDPNCSLNILLNWLTTEGNFDRFRGNNKGEKKLKICNKVVALLQEKGVHVQCNS